MVLFGVVDQKSALRDIPWDMLMLFVGALALGTALTNTGAGDMIGNSLASAVGGTHPVYAEPFRICSICSNLSSDLFCIGSKSDWTGTVS